MWDVCTCNKYGYYEDIIVKLILQDDLPCIGELVLTGNPIHESFGGDDALYRSKISEKVKKLKKLDGK